MPNYSYKVYTELFFLSSFSVEKAAKRLLHE